MGNQIDCTATLNGESSDGRALLETSYLQFRGSFRVKVPFRDMTAVQAENGSLRIRYPDGELTLDLGSAAPKWERKILHPPTLADKLGIKGGEIISVLGLKDEAFLQMLKTHAERISRGRVLKDSDLIFLGAEEKGVLHKLEGLKSSLKRAGAIWVVRPKGRKEITEMDVINEGRAAGLVDTKVVSFSATHTAEKLVIPVKHR